VSLASSVPTFMTYTPSDATWLTTNAAGDETGFWGYDAFGNLAFGTPGSLFGYAGEYTDPSTALSDLRARWYEPQTGEFTTPDPAFASTDAAYTYAGDDPVNETDPSGYGPCGGSKAPTTTVGQWDNQNGRTFTLYCGKPGSSGYGYRHIVGGGHFGGDVNGFVRNEFIGGTIEMGTLVERGRNLAYLYGFKFVVAFEPVVKFRVRVIIKNSRSSITTAYITNPIYDKGYTYTPYGPIPKATLTAASCGLTGTATGDWVGYPADEN